MKKILLLVAALICLITTVDAQKRVKPWKEIFHKDVIREFDDMTVAVTNGVANRDMTKFRLKITNKTNDVLLFKPEESVIKAAVEVTPQEKWLYIYPAESDYRVVDVKGYYFLVPYSYVMSGMYKISISGKGIDTPNFLLPVSQNEFTAGPFSCTMLSLTKESDKTEVKFECKYLGDKVGVIQPSRSAIKLPDGTEIANEKSKSKPIIVMKGKSEKITFKWNRMEGGRAQDMQKIKLEILFRNTFSESELEKMNAETIPLEIDEYLSKK